MTRPLPISDVSTAPFWAAVREQRLEVPTCSACDEHFFPPLPACPACASHDWAWKAVPARGAVYSWTVIHRSGHPYWRERTPYAILMVELEAKGGPRLVGGLVGASPDELRGGEAVEAVFEDVDHESTLVQWRFVR
jgi:uncharacterized OB-fold protein